MRLGVTTPPLWKILRESWDSTRLTVGIILNSSIGEAHDIPISAVSPFHRWKNGGANR
jgi:hypothetical protein